MKKAGSFMEHHKKAVYFAAYTVIFALLSAFVFSFFWRSGKSFIWDSDGFTQHYPSLIYFGAYLRSIVHDFLSTGRLTIPQWDFRIGYGGDILTTLNFYVIGDPLTLLSVFFKPNRTELLYEALVILRLYLAGITFSLYCFNRRLARSSTLVAAFVYVFCGFSIFAAVRHPMFINPMVYLPLLLLGVDRLFEGKKPYLFIVMVAVSAASNFYFFYMLTILTVIYAAFHFFEICKTDRGRRFVGLLLKGVLSFLAGVCLAAVILLPIVIAILGNGRLGIDYSQDLISFGSKFYPKFFGGFIATTEGTSWTFTGYAPIALACLVTLFVQGGKKYMSLAGGFLLLTFFLLVPFFGHMFNGFSYITNRWVFGYSFLVALVVATILPKMFELKKRTWAVLIGVTALYGILALRFLTSTRFPERYAIGFYLLVATVAIVAGVGVLHRYLPSSKENAVKWTGFGAILLITLVSIGSQAWFRYSPSKLDYVSEFIASSRAFAETVSTPASVFAPLPDTSFYRTGNLASLPNVALVSNYNGTTEYFSMINASTPSSLKDLGLSNVTALSFSGLNNRAYLGALASQKYYAAGIIPGTTLRTGSAPYGYELISSKKKGTLSLYKNSYALPLGYTYDNYMTDAEYYSLPLAKRQESLLQSIVVEKKIAGFDQREPDFTSTTVTSTVQASAGAKISGDVLKIKKPGAGVKFTFQGKKNCETYLFVKGLEFKGKNTVAAMNLKSGYLDTSTNFRSPRDSWTYNQTDYLYHLGYAKDAQRYCTVAFLDKGRYRADDIAIVCQPMDGFPAQVNKLREDTLKNIELGTNRVSGTIALREKKILCLSIPDSPGWTAKVDGKEAEILKANGFYMGLPLTAGSHTIELTYRTPGLALGASLTGLSIIALIGAAVVSSKKKNHTSTSIS